MQVPLPCIVCHHQKNIVEDRMAMLLMMMLVMMMCVMMAVAVMQMPSHSIVDDCAFWGNPKHC